MPAGLPVTHQLTGYGLRGLVGVPGTNDVADGHGRVENRPWWTRSLATLPVSSMRQSADDHMEALASWAVQVLA